LCQKHVKNFCKTLLSKTFEQQQHISCLWL
jgi:hypothetical protein